MNSEKNQISVWVCREEKLVLGLSKRTTCADVIQILLEEQNLQRGTHCLVERWRGLERVLPDRTRILRLWGAWGPEQSNVNFALVETEASFSKHAVRSAEARVVPSKQHAEVSAGAPARAPVSSMSPEKQRRIVKKAFRKLEKIKKKPKKKRKSVREDASPCASRMETLVRVVVSQDMKIRQQLRRISELDSEIEGREAEAHLQRVRAHGASYVHDSYLGCVGDKGHTSPQVLEFRRRCEEVLRLQEEVRAQEELQEKISQQLLDELNRRWMQRRRRQELLTGGPRAPRVTQREQEEEEEERIRTQLDASSYIGLLLSADLEAIRSDLALSQQIYVSREKEMRDLQEKVDSLDMEDGAVGGGGRKHGMELRMSTLEKRVGWLCKEQSGKDEDSDTGLSSLHSQDSDCSPPVWESLV